MSAALRKLAAKKPGLLLSTGATLAAHPLRTGVGVLGAMAAGNKARRTWYSMDPAAHRAMLGMN